MYEKKEQDGIAGCFAIFFSLSIVGNFIGILGSLTIILGNQPDIPLAWGQLCLAILSYLFLAAVIQGAWEEGWLRN